MTNNILFKFAKIISYIFVPPVLNLFIFILLAYEFEKHPQILYTITISLLFGFIIPVLTFLEFRRRGMIINDDATIKEERTIPYIYAIIFTLIGVVLTYLFQLDSKIIILWAVYLINSIIILIVNKYWKLSAHAIGASMPLAASLFLDDYLYLAIFTIIIVLVSISRLILKVHTPKQVFAGIITGFSISYILLNYCT